MFYFHSGCAGDDWISVRQGTPWSSAMCIETLKWVSNYKYRPRETMAVVYILFFVLVMNKSDRLSTNRDADPSFPVILRLRYSGLVCLGTGKNNFLIFSFPPWGRSDILILVERLDGWLFLVIYQKYSEENRVLLGYDGTCRRAPTEFFHGRQNTFFKFSSFKFFAESFIVFFSSLSLFSVFVFIGTSSNLYNIPLKNVL